MTPAAPAEPLSRDVVPAFPAVLIPCQPAEPSAPGNMAAGIMTVTQAQVQISTSAAPPSLTLKLSGAPGGNPGPGRTGGGDDDGDDEDPRNNAVPAIDPELPSPSGIPIPEDDVAANAPPPPVAPITWVVSQPATDKRVGPCRVPPLDFPGPAEKSPFPSLRDARTGQIPANTVWLAWKYLQFGRPRGRHVVPFWFPARTECDRNPCV